MKVTVLALFVVLVSTTFALPKFLRSPQQQPPPPTHSQKENKMACVRILDRCEKQEKRFGGDDDPMDYADDLKCIGLLLDEDFSESPQEWECESILWDCVATRSDGSVSDRTAGNGKAAACKDILDLEQEMGDSDSKSGQDYGGDKSDADDNLALRKLRQLLRKIYRKK